MIVSSFRLSRFRRICFPYKLGKLQSRLTCIFSWVSLGIGKLEWGTKDLSNTIQRTKFGVFWYRCVFVNHNQENGI